MNHNTETGNKFWYVIISLVASIISIVVFITGKNLPDFGNKDSTRFIVTSTEVDSKGINGTVDREGSVDICVNMDMSDFVADVTYINPASVPSVPNAGYGFKYVRYYPDSKEVQYATWINWGNSSLYHLSSIDINESESKTNYGIIKFQFPEVAPEQNKTNHLQIVVTKDNAQLFVNESSSPVIDLSEDGEYVNAFSQSKICVAMVNFPPSFILENSNIPNDHITTIEFKDFSVR